jgi:hypothetical protein
MTVVLGVLDGPSGKTDALNIHLGIFVAAGVLIDTFIVRFPFCVGRPGDQEAGDQVADGGPAGGFFGCGAFGSQ